MPLPFLSKLIPVLFLSSPAHLVVFFHLLLELLHCLGLEPLSVDVGLHVCIAIHLVLSSYLALFLFDLLAQGIEVAFLVDVLLELVGGQVNALEDAANAVVLWMDAHRDGRGVDDVRSANEVVVRHLLQFIFVPDVSNRLVGLIFGTPRVFNLELVHPIVVQVTAIRPDIVVHLELMRVILEDELVLEIEVWILLFPIDGLEEGKLLKVVVKVHLLDLVLQDVVLAGSMVLVTARNLNLKVDRVEPLHLILELSRANEFLQLSDVLLFGLLEEG